MKQSDIKAGKTYRGRDGSERTVRHIGEQCHLSRGVNRGLRLFVAYRNGEWWSDNVLLSTFARWAVEEVANA